MKNDISHYMEVFKFLRVGVHLVWLRSCKVNAQRLYPLKLLRNKAHFDNFTNQRSDVGFFF